MKVTPTAIVDVLVIEPQVFSDARGFFLETWNRRKFAEAGLDADFVQDNHSCSVKNTLRGLHYQWPNPQGKLVSVLEGEVYDVAVDVRRGGRYALTLAPGESQRPMRLRLTRTGGALTLSGMSAVASRAGGAEMTFTLSAPAACTVKVLNIAGRTVRVLRQGTPMPAGTSQVLWDGRSDAGLAVPSGTYVLQLEAVTDDGNRTQAVRTLAVQR